MIADAETLGAEMGDCNHRVDSFRDVRAAATAFLERRGLVSDFEGIAARRAANEDEKRAGANGYSVQKFAAAAGKSSRWISKQIRAGIIKADVRYGSTFIPASELPRYLATLSKQTK